MSRRHPLLLPVLCTLLAAVALSACGGSDSPPRRTAATAATTSHAPIAIVAAENFWGSIASQLAGTKGRVTSIIVNPDTDPHDYEPTAADARTMATAQLAIVNGIGYDGWASKLLAADPSSSRVTLDVGDLLGLGDGANPHQWYDPASVQKAIGAITAALVKLDPADASYFTARRQAFETTALAQYDRLRAEIRSKYAGVPVGYSESIFEPLGRDLGLKLLTPPSFADAVAEGTDVTAHDKQTVDAQAQDRRIKVWVFNSQNLSPDVKRINEIARSRGIPIATVTETLSPASDDFEQWQVAQLRALANALHEATGR